MPLFVAMFLLLVIFVYVYKNSSNDFLAFTLLNL